MDPVVAAALSVSVVVYRSDLARLSATLQSLNRAAEEAKRRTLLTTVVLYLIDNDPQSVDHQALSYLLVEPASRDQLAEVQLLSGHGNIGYGAGHNLALQRSDAAYHLILNPDVELAVDALSQALTFLRQESDAGMLAPAVYDASGQRLYLCKRYPTVFDLLLRGFAPDWLSRRFSARLARYELRDRLGSVVSWDVPLVSGCFMLLRRQVWVAVKGFDPEFFLYFEDFDLSLRLARITRLVYVPTVRIVHHGGGVGHKGMRHIGLFLRSAIRFFNRHGWVWY